MKLQLSKQEVTQENKESDAVHNKSENLHKEVTQNERFAKNADQVEWELFEESDRRKLPKIKDIEKIAGVSQWDARKAQDKLKKVLKVS